MMPIQDPKEPKANARLPSLKPNFSITEQELCKDTPLQKKFLTELISEYRYRISGFTN